MIAPQAQEAFDRMVALLEGTEYSAFLAKRIGPLVTVSLSSGMPTPRLIEHLSARAGSADVLQHDSIAAGIRSAIPKILQTDPEAVLQIGVNHASGGGVILTDAAIEVLFGVLETHHKNVHDMLYIVETWEQRGGLVYSLHVFRNGVHHEHLVSQA